MKPCPFCGKDVDYYTNKDESKVKIFCRTCRILITKELHTGTYLHDIWNKRAKVEG